MSNIENIIAVSDSELLERAKSIIRVNLALGEEESLLVVVDEPTFEVGRLFYAAARSLGRRVSLMLIPEGKVSGEEPPCAVAAAMKSADVALCPTVKSMTHTSARIEAASCGTRVVTMPGITMDMLRSGASCADYAQVVRMTDKLTALLSEARTARIEKDGCELTLSLDGRSGVASPGVYEKPGASGNFPSGEAYIAPVENGANGTMVIDGSMVGVGVLDQPLKVVIEEGRLVAVEGENDQGAYRDQLAILFERPENGTIAELGIGTNESARLCGIILEDEKLYGSVHIAFGTNASFGGVTKADCHYDGIILKPTLYLDETCVMRDGEVLV